MSNPFVKRKKGKPNPFAKRSKSTRKPNPFLSGSNGRRKPARGSSRRDFTRSGVRYHNVVQVDGYWEIDITTGDQTLTMHNQHGSWLTRTQTGLKEPKRDIAFALQDRLLVEMKALGIPTAEEKLRQREEAERMARKAKRTNKERGNE